MDYYCFFGVTFVLYTIYNSIYNPIYNPIYNSIYNSIYNPIHLYNKYKFKNKLLVFFGKYNKSKIDQVDKIVEKYIDNPKYLMSILSEKYK